MGRRHKEIRGHDLGLTREEWAALTDTSVQTVVRMEQRKGEHPYEFALFALIMHDIPESIITLLAAWWKRPCDQDRYNTLLRIACRHMGRHARTLWVEKMKQAHPELSTVE